jgi:hypothetical protein
MRFTQCVLVLAAADPCLLSQAGVVDLSTKTVSLFSDIVSIVSQGLYVEGSKLAGPATMKEFHAKVDLVQIEYSKVMKTAGPQIELVKSEVMKQWGVASTAVSPYLAKLNTMLDTPLKDFAAKLPEHAGLLVAESLLDKVLLLTWLIFAMTICLRIVNFCIGVVFRIIFFPCRLCCGKRKSKDAPASGKKAANGKKFAGNSQQGSGNPSPQTKKK